MTTKRDAGKALRTFIQKYGVPTYLTFDGAPEQVGDNTLFMEQVKKMGLIGTYQHQGVQIRILLKELFEN